MDIHIYFGLIPPPHTTATGPQRLTPARNTG